MMDSSDSSEEDFNVDETILTRDFDAEKDLIVRNLLPNKSRAQYELSYARFLKWKEDNKAVEINETVLIVHFKGLSKKWKPSTLWSYWSKLRTMLNIRHGININDYLLLESFIKYESKGFRSKKSLVLSWSEIRRFLDNGEDYIYLGAKVVLIFGVFGALRCQELINLETTDVQDTRNVNNTHNQYIVTIKDTKNDYPRQFVIGDEYYDIVKKYISLRPDNIPSNRFFVSYHKNKCIRQFIGKNKISEIPKTIALYLNLSNPEGYTGHCFRRSSATAAANARLDFTKIKQLGGWRSDAVAQGYIENSSANRENIFHRIANQVESNCSKTLREPSNSKTYSSTTQSIIDKETSTILDKNSHLDNTNVNLKVMPSTSKQKPSETSNYNTNNNLSSTNVQEPHVIPQSSSSPDIHYPSKDLNCNEDYHNFERRTLKKIKLVIDNNTDDETVYKSTSVTFQNCEIHNITINHYYTGEKK